MKKIFLLSTILIIILFTFTGCDYSRGIDNYYFITALGLDLEDNGLLKISIQTSSNSSGSSGGESSSSSQSSAYQIYSVEAKTIDEGINILDNYLSKPINLSHCSALILSEKLAKQGVQTYIHTLSNNTELRHSCHILISSSTAYDVMEKVSNSGEVFSARLYDYLTTTSNYTGYSIESTFGEFFQALNTDYYEASTAYTLVSDNTIQSDGIAIFKDEFMVGHLDVLDSIAHLIVTNKLDNCIITTENPFQKDEYMDLDITLYKNTEINIEVINGTPLISIKVYPEGTIKSSGSTFNYINDGNISDVENSVNNYFDNILKNYLYSITKTYNSDIAGFSWIYKSKFLTEEDFKKIHWDEIFSDSFFEIEVESQINSSNLFNEE